MSKGRKAISNHKEEQNERSRDRCFQRKKHGGCLRPMGEVALLPQEFLHTGVGLEQMAYAILALGEDTRVVMEATGRYHEPVATALHEYGIYVY